MGWRTGRVLLAVLVCLTAILPRRPVFAEPSAERGGDFVVRRWTSADGLPQNSVTGVLQAEDGYLWLTTFGGVVRFDGVRFDVFDRSSRPSVEGDRFVGGAQDQHGVIYFAVQGGGLVSRRPSGFETIIIPAAPHGAVSGPVRDGRGTLWVAVSSTLVRIQDGALSTSQIPPETLGSGVQLLVDEAGVLWLASDLGVTCWDERCDRPREPLEPGPEWLGAVERAAGGGLWSARWGPAQGCALEPPHRDSWIRTIAWAGRRWCVVGPRLSSLGPSGRETRIELDDLPSWDSTAPEAVASLAQDREGALWIGTAGGGLYQLQTRGVTRYGRSRGLPGSTTWEIVEDAQGRILLNNRAQLTILEDGRPQPIPAAVQDELPILAMATDPKKQVWLATHHGIARLEGQRLVRAELPSLAGETVSFLAFDRLGTMWIGLECGDTVALPLGGPAQRFDRARLGGLSAVTVAPDGSRWFATEAGVVHEVGDQLRRFGPEQGLPAGARSIYVDPEGGVWIGTYGGGLNYLADDHLAQAGVAQGLPENVASCILAEADDLWINGNRGVSRIRRADLLNLMRRQTPAVQSVLYNTGEGNGAFCLRRSDGRLWFPTINGAVEIDPKSMHLAAAPLAHVESVEVDGQPLPPRGIAPPGRGDVVVRSTAISFIDPAAVVFRQRLIGLSDRWVDVGHERVARYSSLAPGRYRFEIAARSVDGAWSEPAAVELELRPFLHQTRAFLIVAGGLGLLLLYAGSTWRTRAIERRNQALRTEIQRRTEVEAALRVEEAHYRSVFERTSDGLFVLAGDGRLMEVNAAGCALLGRERSSLLASAPLSYVAPANRAAVEQLLAALMAKEPGHRLEVELVGPQESAVVVRLEGVRLDHLSPPHVLLSAVDLTAEKKADRDRRELEAQLGQSQKLEALGLLAAGIAHDFNNLLTAIGGQAAMIRASGREDREMLEGIHTAVKRATALAKKLLVFGKKDTNSPHTVGLEQSLSDTVAMLRRTIPAEVELSLEHGAPDLAVEIDPVRLEQIVINLVVNSRDAIKGAGRIRVHSGTVELDAVAAHKHSVGPGSYVRIGVSDSGAGITPEILPRIFEPFFTTKEVGKGSGLGLSIVHGAVREARGFVTVESLVGKGTDIAVYLPRVELGPEHKSIPPQLEPRAATVMVCDDEPAVRRIVVRALRLAGYAVIEAESPEQAAELIERGEPVDLLITDVVMPGLSGPELATRVRAKLPELLVLFMSGHTRDLLDERGPPKGQDFLQKPFTISTLQARVARLFRTGSGGSVEQDDEA
ncbi:MAG: ATP-binding protein [Myxococcota bacterium]